MSLLKKALQLAKLSNCQVYLKIYNNEDRSLLELDTSESFEGNSLSLIKPDSPSIDEYVKVLKENYLLIEKIEDQITKHGHLNLKSENDFN